MLILASILMMFRAYYFGQVIYFTRSSRLEAAAAFATLAAVAALSLLLIPRLGATGAALAFAGGQSAACLVLVLGARRAGHRRCRCRWPTWPASPGSPSPAPR